MWSMLGSALMLTMRSCYAAYQQNISIWVVDRKALQSIESEIFKKNWEKQFLKVFITPNN